MFQFQDSLQTNSDVRFVESLQTNSDVRFVDSIYFNVLTKPPFLPIYDRSVSMETIAMLLPKVRASGCNLYTHTHIDTHTHEYTHIDTHRENQKHVCT